MEDMVVLMERGVPVMKLLGEVTGKNAAELADMSAKGTITIDMIDKLIIKMGEAASGSNAIAMETLNGKISSLSDAWHVFEDTLLNDKSEGFLKSIVADWTIDLDLLTNAIGSSAENQIAHMKDVMTFYNHLRGVIGLAPAESKGDLTKIKQLEDEIAANKKLVDSENEKAAALKESDDAKKTRENAAKEASKDAAKAQDAITKSSLKEIDSLSDKHKKMTLSERDYYAQSDAIKNMTPAQKAWAMAQWDVNNAQEVQNKGIDYAKSKLSELKDKYEVLTLSARDYLSATMIANKVPEAEQKKGSYSV